MRLRVKQCFGNGVCEELQKLHRMVEAVKKDREVGVAYMKSWEIEREWKAEGQRDGRIDILIELAADGLLSLLFEIKYQ